MFKNAINFCLKIFNVGFYQLHENFYLEEIFFKESLFTIFYHFVDNFMDLLSWSQLWIPEKDGVIFLVLGEIVPFII